MSEGGEFKNKLELRVGAIPNFIIKKPIHQDQFKLHILRLNNDKTYDEFCRLIYKKINNQIEERT
jgi:hypothetical protein